MCGIIGAVAQKNVISLLLEGLKRLEYRGYDSAGIVVINDHQQFERIRTAGNVQELQRLVEVESISGKIGIAHTRWATHGKPTVYNAHPHIAGDEIALVHNGIIENHKSLRSYLISEGCVLTSETDSELVAHLIYLKIKSGHDFLSAVQSVRKDLKGAYAIAFLHNKEPERLLAIRSGCPLVVGLNEGENFIASDTLALLPFTKRFIFLEEDDLVDIQGDKFTIYDDKNKVVNRSIHVSDDMQDAVSKGNYPHYMLKEIFEQPKAVLSAMEGRITPEGVLVEAFGMSAPDIFRHIQRVQIVACGTSYHAGLTGKYWMEEIGNIPCQVEIASEHRYRYKVMEPNTLFVTLSQSGETADTLAALRLAKKSGYTATLTICNVPGSSLVRESDLVLMMGAGPEIGVASTKSFTCQLVALLLLSMSIGRYHQLTKDKERELINILMTLPLQLNNVLELNSAVKRLSKEFADKQHTIFLGRGIEFPIAMEGALKLKEISYIHAEAYPAGELKHGPLALIDSSMPVIAIAPYDPLLDKLKSNLEEVHARDGQLIIFADARSALEDMQAQIINMPAVDPLLAPIVYSVPLQLLAYHVGVIKGTDIDQPRNLAKSVTVE